MPLASSIIFLLWGFFNFFFQLWNFQRKPLFSEFLTSATRSVCFLDMGVGV